MALTITAEPVLTWADFVRIATSDFVGRWHFRGGLDNWSLEPSLQRLAKDWDVPLEELPRVEGRLLREFKRAYPPRADVPKPEEKDTLAWLALMQHHGAPTRLLDWTYSPFVAAFFALDVLLASRDPTRMAAIWALSVRPVENQSIEALLPNGALKEAFREYSISRDGPSFRAVFFDSKPPVLFATPVNPYGLNERLIVQQGLFLCPGTVDRSFEDNLSAVPGATDPVNLRKLMLPRSALSEAFVSLHRMNISHATLFPGVDGYSRTLRHRLAFLRKGDFFDATKW